MKKGYYLFAPVDESCVGAGSGIERKVRSQVKALSNYVDIDLITMPVVKYSGAVTEKIIRRLPFTAGWRKWDYMGEFHEASFVYIRQVDHDDSFTRYLRQVKRDNPTIKIVYEIPTFSDMKASRISMANFPFEVKERICCKKAAEYMDRIVTFYSQDEIWGVPCIQLINGFDFSQVELPNRPAPKSVQMISVAATAFWHGYDRLIKGIYNYYQSGGTEQITYHMVGNILPELQEMVQKYHLEEHVIFHGRQSGEALRKLYEQCYLGVDVLGGHRKNYPISSSLKSREYFAYGIPLITSSPVDFLPNDSPYQLVVPYTESPVDIDAVVQFYHGLYDVVDCRKLASTIRAYAEARCDMKVTMKPVADWLMRV